MMPATLHLHFTATSNCRHACMNGCRSWSHTPSQPLFSLFPLFVSTHSPFWERVRLHGVEFLSLWQEVMRLVREGGLASESQDITRQRDMFCPGRFQLYISHIIPSHLARGSRELPIYVDVTTACALVSQPSACIIGMYWTTRVGFTLLQSAQQPSILPSQNNTE